MYEIDIYKDNWVPSFISESIEELSGYKADDFLFLKIFWKDLIHPDDRENIFKDAEVLLSPGVQLTQIYRIVHKNGTIKFIRDIKYSHLDHGNLKISGIVIDVTTFQLTHRENLLKIEELINKNNELLKSIEYLSLHTIPKEQLATKYDCNLSSRESEVLELFSQGKLYKIIAFELGISIETVKTHIKNIRRKLANSEGERTLSRSRLP